MTAADLTLNELDSDVVPKPFRASLWLEMSTVWIFTPRLPWTVVGFVTHCQRFVNGLEINVKTNSIFLKLMKFGNIAFEEYLLFDRYSKEIRPFGSIH